MSKLTITEALADLLDAIEAKRDLLKRDPEAFKAEFEADPRWEKMREATPHLWKKAMKGDLSKDEPHLKNMLEHIAKIRSGEMSVKKAYRAVETEITQEYVVDRIGAPDQYGRPTGKPK